MVYIPTITAVPLLPQSGLGMPPARQGIQVHAKLGKPGVDPQGCLSSLDDGDGNPCSNPVDASFPLPSKMSGKPYLHTSPCWFFLS